MEGMPQNTPRTVDEVFNDFKGRRAGLIKALTTGLFSLSLSLSLGFSPVLQFLLHRVSLSFFSLIFVYVFIYFWGADVDKFYQQCDPGEYILSLV